MTPPEIGATRPAPPPPPPAPGPLRAARVILDRPGTIEGPGWARCVALLARQALDDAVSAFWDRRVPGMAGASGRSQLVALRFYVDDPALARHAHQTWATLSDATHHHGYELAPTAGELRAWLEAVSRIVERLGAHDSEAAPPAGSPPV